MNENNKVDFIMKLISELLFHLTNNKLAQLWISLLGLRISRYIRISTMKFKHLYDFHVLKNIPVLHSTFFINRYPNRNNVPITKTEKGDNDETKKNFRRVLAQVLASSAKNLLVFNFGLAITFPTILIPALSGLNTSLNPNETLTITPNESTWIGNYMINLFNQN